MAFNIGLLHDVQEIESNEEDQSALLSDGNLRADGLIEVFTMDGKIYASGNNELKIIEPGIYIVRASDKSQKIIVRE